MQYPVRILVGRTPEVLERAQELVRLEGREVDGDPDISIQAHDGFGIADARELKARASQRGLTHEPIYVVAVTTILHDAQNALLKLFEEPPAGASFILCVPSLEVVLPTVRSRAVVVESAGGEASAADPPFLAMALSERLKLVEKMVKDTDRAGAARLLEDTERALAARHDPALAPHLARLIETRRYLASPASSLKQLLEFQAITLPTLPTAK
ncbi:hypothetical protein GVX82_00805 [Patescibacteria group bacterium]|jgi:hypothetical protein|nr:hypothetical protein [Patescibacteria group bacterium]